MTGWWPAAVPVQPDGGTARRWAVQELAHREYARARPGWLSRLWGWLQELVSQLPAPTGVPSAVGVTVALLVLGAAGWWVLRRTGGARSGRSRTAGPAVLDGPRQSAAAHRAAAEAAAAAGQWQPAVLHRFRAVAADLEEYSVIGWRPGWTASEVAAAGGAALPGLLGELGAAARLFEAVAYGDRGAGPAEDARLRAVQAAVDQALAQDGAAGRRPAAAGPGRAG